MNTPLALQQLTFFMPRHIVSFIAASADGFIADPNGNIDFLNMAELPGEDYGYTAFTATVDTVILGRKTYEKVLSLGVDNPHPDKELFVFSRSERAALGHVRFVQEDPVSFAASLKQIPGKDIYCDGGADIVKQLLAANLIDRIILTTIPVNLHEGIALFPGGLIPEDFSLKEERHYLRGINQRVFERTDF